MASAEYYEVEFPLEGAVLTGSLLVPETVRAGVIFAPAGGLADRDGNDADVGFAPLRQLAEGLAAHEIASLRPEGRGVGRSTGTFVGPQAAFEDFVLLISQAARYPELGPKPFLLGHGPGATLALVAANQLGDQLAGAVLIAPPISPVGELMAYRAAVEAALADLPPGEHRTRLAEVQAEHGRRKSFLPPNLKPTLPILIVQGALDWVFPPAESERLASQVPGATRQLLAGLDHWLVPVEAWRGPGENLQPDLRVSEDAVAGIADWLLARRASLE